MPLQYAGGSPTTPIWAYCLASMSMIVANKYCVSYPKWNMSLFLLAVQSFVCILAIQTCRVLRWRPQPSTFDVGKARTWLPVSFLFVGMIYTGTKALQYTTFPVYTIFKNLSIIVIAYGEVMWFGGRVRLVALLPFGVMVLSPVMIVWSDTHKVLEEYSPSGLPRAETEVIAKLSVLQTEYGWMALNVICTSAYALSMHSVIKKADFKDLDVMFYNNLLGFPILLVGTYFYDDWSASNLQQNFPPFSRHWQIFAIVSSSLIAIAVSYTTPWCIRATSPTTYSMVGCLTKIPVAVYSIFYFWDPEKQGTVPAIALGLIGGLVYSWVKLNDGNLAKTTLPMNEYNRVLDKGATMD